MSTFFYLNLIKTKTTNINIFCIYFLILNWKLAIVLKNIKNKFTVQIKKINAIESPQLHYNIALLVSMPHLEFLKKNNYIIWIIIALVTIFIILTILNERIKENINIWLRIFFTKIICLIVICYFSKSTIPPEIIIISFYFAFYQFFFVVMRAFQWTGGTIKFWHWPKGVKAWLTSPRIAGIMLRVLTKKINPNNIYVAWADKFFTKDFFIDFYIILLVGSMINTLYCYYVLSITPPDMIDILSKEWIPMFWNMFYLILGLALFIEFAAVFNYVGLYFLIFWYWFSFSNEPHFIDFCDIFLIKGLRQPGTYLNHCKTTLLLGLITIFFGLIML